MKNKNKFYVFGVALFFLSVFFVRVDSARAADNCACTDDTYECPCEDGGYTEEEFNTDLLTMPEEDFCVTYPDQCDTGGDEETVPPGGYGENDSEFCNTMPTGTTCVQPSGAEGKCTGPASGGYAYCGPIGGNDGSGGTYDPQCSGKSTGDSCIGDGSSGYSCQMDNGSLRCVDGSGTQGSVTQQDCNDYAPSGQTCTVNSNKTDCDCVSGGGIGTQGCIVNCENNGGLNCESQCGTGGIGTQGCLSNCDGTGKSTTECETICGNGNGGDIGTMGCLSNCKDTGTSETECASICGSGGGKTLNQIICDSSSNSCLLDCTSNQPSATVGACKTCCSGGGGGGNTGGAGSDCTTKACNSGYVCTNTVCEVDSSIGSECITNADCATLWGSSKPVCSGMMQKTCGIGGGGGCTSNTDCANLCSCSNGKCSNSTIGSVSSFVGLGGCGGTTGGVGGTTSECAQCTAQFTAVQCAQYCVGSSGGGQTITKPITVGNTVFPAGTIIMPNGSVIPPVGSGLSTLPAGSVNGASNTASGKCGTNFAPIGGVCFPTNTGLANPAGGITQIVANLFFWLMGLFTTLAIIAFVISGLQYFLASGDEEMAESAKTNAKNALIGIIIGLSGFIIVRAISAALSGGSTIF